MSYILYIHIKLSVHDLWLGNLQIFFFFFSFVCFLLFHSTSELTNLLKGQALPLRVQIRIRDNQATFFKKKVMKVMFIQCLLIHTDILYYRSRYTEETIFDNVWRWPILHFLSRNVIVWLLYMINYFVWHCDGCNCHWVVSFFSWFCVQERLYFCIYLLGRLL